MPETPAQSAQTSLPTFSPLYKQIKNLLMKQLGAGVWKAGEVLPSEMELAERMAVSQGTVRKAIDEMVAEHLLIRRQGKGTYVTTHSAAGVQYRFLRLRPDVGERQPATSVVHSCKLVAASALAAQALSLEPKAKVLQVERTLSLGGKPVVFETIYLQPSLFAGLTAQRMSNYTGPMYALFESEFGVSMTRAQEQVRAVAATAKLALALNLNEGAPLLQATRSSFSYNQTVVELRLGWYVTQDYYYWSELD